MTGVFGGMRITSVAARSPFQVQIHDRRVGLVRLDRPQRVVGGIRRDDLELTQPQQVDQWFPQGAFVFDDEDEAGRSAHDGVIGQSWSTH